MLRIIQNRSSDGAKSYYASGLSRNDYYTEGQEIVGNWGGEGAKLLGLEGEVDKQNFSLLCDNLNPISGGKLTPRNSENRSVGYDINFSVPKSVSVVHAQTQDSQILEVFNQSLRETMSEIEKDVATRIRSGGQNQDRITSNLIYGEFIHLTSRPVDGVPDPHLHAHCFTFNATFDQEENKWKAAKFRSIKENAPYYEAMFDLKMANGLQKIGYGIQKTPKSYEIAGLEKTTLDKFSRRTKEIESIAQEKGVLSDKDKDRLGARTRNHKSKSYTQTELRQVWSGWLNPSELVQLNTLKSLEAFHTQNPGLSDQAIEFSLRKNFERQSVVSERAIMVDAFKYATGLGSADVASITQSQQRKINQKEVIDKSIDGKKYVTTKEVLKEEQEMVQIYNGLKGRYPPLNSKYEIQRDFLSQEQQKAVKHALNSKDGVISIRGGAGVGKTTILTETVSGIENGGKKVFTFAPSSEASRNVLRSEGFTNATTVQSLLINPDMQRQTQSNVILVDEAGLLSSKQMNQLLKIARDQNARVILSGDTRQHSSVERGDALRVLYQEGGLRPIEINEIRRQTGNYKEIVKQISKGDILKAFNGLEKMGWIKELPDQDRVTSIAEDYVKILRAGKTVLVVSPTHTEGELTTQAIRDKLKENGYLTAEENTLKTQKSLGYTDAEKADLRNYQPGQIVQLNQNISGYGRGQKYQVEIQDKRPVIVSRNGQIKPIPAGHASKFDIYDQKSINVAKGDLLQITKNGFTKDNEHRLNNGAIFRVKDFTAAGDVKLENGWILDKDFGNVKHGYATTSHSSQGKTVDHVLIAQSSSSFTASNEKQAYVSISRGKMGCTIYTDDKVGLRQAVARIQDRMSAHDLIKIDQESPLIRKIRSRAVNKRVLPDRDRQDEKWSKILKGRGSPTPSKEPEKQM